MRFTVNDASQSAAARIDTRSSKFLYSILLPRHRHCSCIPQSLRWRVLDPPPAKPKPRISATSSDADTGGGGRLGQQEMAITSDGKNRIMIFGPKNDARGLLT